MPGGLDAQAKLDFATDYLYNRWGLKIAKVGAGGLVSAGGLVR